MKTEWCWKQRKVFLNNDWEWEGRTLPCLANWTYHPELVPREAAPTGFWRVSHTTSGRAAVLTLNEADARACVAWLVQRWPRVPRLAENQALMLKVSQALREARESGELTFFYSGDEARAAQEKLWEQQLIAALT